tara:strand:+ start:2029 stop:2412 length:384 start_codon:yes stop_codon:yes gene_type:complete
MSKGRRYTQEFKIEAVKQTNERGYSVAELSEWLGICTKTRYHWRSPLFDKPKLIKEAGDQLRIAKLEAELKHVKEERDILKKAASYFAPPNKVRLHAGIPTVSTLSFRCAAFSAGIEVAFMAGYIKH